MEDTPRRRLVQVTDVDGFGRRHTVLVTADPAVVSATERAIRDRVSSDDNLNGHRNGREGDSPAG